MGFKSFFSCHWGLESRGCSTYIVLKSLRFPFVVIGRVHYIHLRMDNLIFDSVIIKILDLFFFSFFFEKCKHLTFWAVTKQGSQCSRPLSEVMRALMEVLTRRVLNMVTLNLSRYSWKGLAHWSSVISAWQKWKVTIWKSSLLWWQPKKEEAIVGKMYWRKTWKVESKVCGEF